MTFKKYILLLLLFAGVNSYLFSQNDTSFAKIFYTFPKSGTYQEKLDFVNKKYDSLKQALSFKQRYYYLVDAKNYFSENKELLCEAMTMNSLGLFYNHIGNYSSAIKAFDDGIVLANQHKQLFKQSNEVQTILYLIHLNYGNTFYFLNDPNKALKHYKKALSELRKKSILQAKDSLNIAQVFNNIGITFGMKKDYETSTFYFKQALYLNITLKDSSRIANVLSNLASLHADKQQPDSALKLYFIVKSIYEQGADKADLAFVNSQIAGVYNNTKRHNIALPFALKALTYCDTVIYSNELINTYQILYNIYGGLKDYKNENKYLKLYYQLSDSLHRTEILSEQNQRDLLTQFNTIHLTDSIKSVEEIKLRDLSIAAKRNQTYFLISLLLLTIIGLSIIYSRFKITKEQKSIIEIQKSIVDEKNKEITDSITYAKRLQSAILPTESDLKSHFKNNFILFKPKDIVSGDFCFLEKKGDIVYIAAADCTGHGVPGAMLSIACHNALQRAIFEYTLDTPGELLDVVKTIVVDNFNKSEKEIKDGMDISLLLYNVKTRNISWAGANNRLVYFKNGQLTEIKADRKAVGKTEIETPFSSHYIPYSEGLTFYLFTDGIIDQFGGDRNKKYTIGRFRDLLESIKNKELFDQKTIITAEFDTWKGGNSQTDDVSVIGLRI